MISADVQPTVGQQSFDIGERGGDRSAQSVISMESSVDSLAGQLQRGLSHYEHVDAKKASRVFPFARTSATSIETARRLDAASTVRRLRALTSG
jgi:hypothetical protein